jgi:hypothetical protein
MGLRFTGKMPVSRAEKWHKLQGRKPSGPRWESALSSREIAGLTEAALKMLGKRKDATLLTAFQALSNRSLDASIFVTESQHIANKRYELADELPCL